VSGSAGLACFCEDFIELPPMDVNGKHPQKKLYLGRLRPGCGTRVVPVIVGL
jgi:hypothetical protein